MIKKIVISLLLVVGMSGTCFADISKSEIESILKEAKLSVKEVEHLKIGGARVFGDNGYSIDSFSYFLKKGNYRGGGKGYFSLDKTGIMVVSKWGKAQNVNYDFYPYDSLKRISINADTKYLFFELES